MSATLFEGGRIWTDRPSDSDALLITDGMITALGDTAREIADTLPNVELVNLNGGVLLPSFSDGHLHPIFGGRELLGPQTAGLDSLEAILAELKRYADAHPEKEWIIDGCFDTSFIEGARFRAEWIDSVIPDRPVVLSSFDHHSIWANSEAMRRAGVDASTPEPADGIIDRDPDGSPSGMFREWGAFGLINNAIPSRAGAESQHALEVACKALNKFGITWMQDAWVEPADIDDYLALAARGGLTVRTDLAQRADPDHWREQLSSFVEARQRVQAFNDHRLLTADTVKFFCDGIVESMTASMLEPYTGCDHSGLPVWEPDELAEAVTAFDKLGFRTHIHAIGDRGVRISIDAIEHAVRSNPNWDRRPTITHLQVVDHTDLPRIAQLGIIANYQALWFKLDSIMMRLTMPQLGEDRGNRQYPIGTSTQLGGPISMSSDWPVSSPDPLLAMRVAVTRQTDEGTPAGGWMPEERISALDALRGYTFGSAFQGATEQWRGRIRVGAAADLVAFDTDFVEDFACITEATLIGTWLDGKKVS